LAAFGATFESANPFVRIVLVWPEKEVPGISQEQAANYLRRNFSLIKITTDEDEAMQMLESGQTDVVQIVPEFGSAIGDGERPEIQFISRTIDPNAEAWIRSLGFGELNYINKQFLLNEAELAQDQANEADESLKSAKDKFIQIRDNLASLDMESIDELRLALAQLRNVLPPESLAQANISPELNKLHHDMDILLNGLDELEKSLGDGNQAGQVEGLNNVIEEIDSLHETIAVFRTVTPENIITPVRDSYTNLRGGAYPLVIFFAPAVLALLIQQLAITLASLGLVREQQMGAFEMFRVSPLRFSQILLGKSLAYILFSTTAGIILTALLTLLDVPFPADPIQFLLALILLATASVGIGFLISALSRTDSQAIQLSMLVLLLSIFFTGFFLPISGFRWPALIITLLIPMSYAIELFQQMMLAGVSAGYDEMIALAFLSMLAFGAVLSIMKYKYRKLSN
jgi:ABC-2 type transport system permease protein